SLRLPRARGSTPFPYTTLFRSRVGVRMTDSMIRELIAAYAQAAVHAREGGLDGVEVHAAHGYLPQQFISTIYNDRTDEWGGSFEDRKSTRLNSSHVKISYAVFC